MYYYRLQINYCNKDIREEDFDNAAIAMRTLIAYLHNPYAEVHSAFIVYGFLTETYCDGMEEEVFIHERDIVSLKREDMLIVRDYYDSF